ncbi:hypothetical protein ACFLUV_05390, partial [Elusimicrobiota bacterium]
VPESDVPPHRSLYDNKFYIRAGGVFVPVDLRIIEDLFYKMKSPILDCEIRLNGHPNLSVILKNIGKAIARFPAFVIELPHNIKISSYYIDGNTRNIEVLQRNEYAGEKGRYAVYHGNADRVIHPGGELHVINFQLPLGVPDINALANPLEFKYRLFAENMKEIQGSCLTKIK